MRSQHHFACKGQDGSWDISRTKGTWLVGQVACKLLGPDYRFAAPTNSKDNDALKAAKAGITHVWLNASDRGVEGQWLAH